MLAAAAAAAFVSCNKEEDVINEEVNGEGIALTISTGEATKTAYDGTNIGWLYTDVIGVANSSEKKEFTQTGASYTGMKSTTQFSGTVPSVGTYYAYYPYSESMLSVSGVTVKLPSEQVQYYVDSSFDSFSPDADILVSQPIDVTSTSTTVSTKFKRLGAFLKISFNTSGLSSSLKTALDAQSIYGLTVTSDTDLAGSVAIDLANGELAGLSNGEKTIKLGYQASSIVPSSISYVGIYPQTIPAGTELTITADTPKYSITRTITLTSALTIGSGKILPVTVALEDADVEHKVELQRQWGWYSDASTLWTPNVTAISITHPETYGMARGLAMDDEYIYLPKSSAYAAIAAVKITDPTTQVKGSVSGVDVGGTFKSSFVRMMKNTDPSVNGGKDVLLLSNLTAADAANVVIYAYTSGIENAPVILAQFAWDSANNVADWRRYGDRFYVTGTWQDGKIYLPSYNANKIVALKVANGARTAVEQYAAGDANSPDGIKDLTVYPGDDKLFLTNGSIANLVSATGGKSAQGWDEYALSASSSNGVGTWGYNFFSFNGKNYIAYARTSGNKAWIEVIVDKGDLITSLAAQEGLMKSPIHSDSDLDATHATGGVADCCVRIIGGEPYIVALTRDGGLVVDKMVLK